MRISSLAASLLFFVFSLSASAEDSPRKDLNLGVSFGYQGLALRKLVNENNLVFLGVGYINYANEGNSSNSYSNNNSVAAGARHYLSNNKLSNFIQLELSGTYTNMSATSLDGSARLTSAILGYGLEYFLDAQLSVEARAGISYTYTANHNAGSYGSFDNTSKTLSLPVVGIAITRYF